MKNIPLFDLKKLNQPYRKKILQSWSEIYDSNTFTGGKETQLFEKSFAEICGTKFAVGVQSGTDSLIVSLLAIDLKQGDEVITTPCTFSATTDAIIHAGAKPVFVDINPKTGNIDPNKIVDKITSKTKGILLVHLYGIPCDMDEIMYIARRNSLFVLEDASHAHGSLYKGQPVGSFGIAGCFSLYPSKSLGALGNAGIITSNNKVFIEKVRIIANHGIKNKKNKYTHHLNGLNKLINNLQSAALVHKLPDLQKNINKKLMIAEKYNLVLKQVSLSGMFWPEFTRPSLYVYAFQTKNRQKTIKHFSQHKIDTGIYYPIPLHLQPSMKSLNYKKGDFPNAEKFFKQTLSIPISPYLTLTEVEHIMKTISSL